MSTKEKIIAVLVIVGVVLALWYNNTQENNYLKDMYYSDGYDSYMYEFENELGYNPVCRKKDIEKAYKKLLDPEYDYGVNINQGDIDTFSKIITLFKEEYEEYIALPEPKSEEKYMKAGELGAKEDIEVFMKKHGGDYVYAADASEWISNHVEKMGSESLQYILDYTDFLELLEGDFLVVDDIETMHENRR